MMGGWGSGHPISVLEADSRLLRVMSTGVVPRSLVPLFGSALARSSATKTW